MSAVLVYADLFQDVPLGFGSRAILMHFHNDYFGYHMAVNTSMFPFPSSEHAAKPEIVGEARPSHLWWERARARNHHYRDVTSRWESECGMGDAAASAIVCACYPTICKENWGCWSSKRVSWNTARLNFRDELISGMFTDTALVRLTIFVSTNAVSLRYVCCKVRLLCRYARRICSEYRPGRKCLGMLKMPQRDHCERPEKVHLRPMDLSK